jgi:hypothetical protein
MLRKILEIYIIASLVPILLICGLSYIIYPHILMIILLGLIIFVFFIFLGLAFHYSLALIIEQLEEMLSSIKIESIAAALPMSEPVFNIEREQEEEV